MERSLSGRAVWLVVALITLLLTLPDINRADLSKADLSARRAEASQPFNPTFDITQLSPQAPGVTADVSYKVTVPAGDHLPARATFTLPSDWDVGSGAPVGAIVGSASVHVDESPCDGGTEFFGANIVNETPGDNKARWRAVLSGALAFDFFVNGDASSGHTIKANLFVDSIYCSPLTLNITHRGKTISGDPVMINPTTEGFYTWDVTFVSAPLSIPPEHEATESDTVAVSPDSDGDTVPDINDNCPNTSNFSQADLDGDGIGDVCDDDIDGDGWTNTAEQFITTDWENACTPNGWPVDPEPAPDGNGVVQINDVTFVVGRFGSSEGDPAYSPRAELASQNGVIQIDDVTAAAGAFGQTC